MAVGRHGKKKPMAILADSGSSCDEFEIQVASPSGKARRADRRARSDFADSNNKEATPSDGPETSGRGADTGRTGSYAERRTLLMQQRVKRLEEETTLEFSASEWNEMLGNTKKKPSAAAPEKRRETPMTGSGRLHSLSLERPDEPSPPSRKHIAPPTEKVALVSREEPLAALPQKVPAALPKAAATAVSTSAQPDETHVQTDETRASELPERTERKTYAERRRLLRCTPRAQDAMEQDEEGKEPLFADDLPSRSKSAVAVRETKTPPPPRTRAQTNPCRHPRAKTHSPDVGKRPAKAVTSHAKDVDQLERVADVERPRAATNPGPGKRTRLAPDVGVVTRSRSAVNVRSKSSPSPSGTASPTKKTADGLLPFFLASCPSEVLADAIIVMKKYGGFYAAGDAEDDFHKDVLAAEQAESWKASWKGKVEMCYNMMKQINPGKQIIAIAIAGGAACDWERQQIFTKFCKVHEDLILKQVGDIEDLEAWLQRTGYKAKAVSYGTRKAVGKATATGRRIRAPPKVATA